MPSLLCQKLCGIQNKAEECWLQSCSEVYGGLTGLSNRLHVPDQVSCLAATRLHAACSRSLTAPPWPTRRLAWCTRYPARLPAAHRTSLLL